MNTANTLGQQRPWRLLLVPSLATLVACGGGDGPEPPPPPAPTVTVTTAVRDVTVDEGQVATFSIGVSTSLPFVVQWSRNDVVVAARSGTELTLAPATLDDDGAHIRALVTAGVNSPGGGSATTVDAGTARLSVTMANPAAPTGLGANAQGSATSALLVWADNSNNETGFEVIRATSGQDVVMETVGANDRTFFATGLTPGASETFRVRAVRAVAGRVAKSSAVSVTVTMPGATPEFPAAPTNARLTPTSGVAGAVDFAWDDNADNETSFQLFRVVDGSDVVLGSITADQTQARISGLAAGSTHTFRVRAVRSANGTTTQSAFASATITVPTPQALTVTLTPTHDNVVRISTIDASVANQVLNQVPVEVGCAYIIDFGAAGSAATCSRSLLLFDLSAVAGRTIRRAELRLQPVSGAIDFTPAREFRIGAVVQAWNPATVNGNTVWSISSTGLVLAPLSTGELARSFDVTTIVNRWASGAQANNGFGLGLAGEAIPTDLITGAYGMFNSFASLENSFAQRRPQLVIEFE